MGWKLIVGGTVAALIALALASPAAAQRLKVKEFQLPGGGSPSWITVGPDRNLWFTADHPGHYIGRITPKGVVSTFPTPTPFSAPDHITTGPDGALWFTERNTSRIGRITTRGEITEFPLPTPDAQPRGIARGPDGALWFTEFGVGRIGRITTAGAVTEYSAASLDPFSRPVSIVRGPDNNLWFTVAERDNIGRITPQGAITTYFVSYRSGPESLTVGPDRALWFTEDDGNRIGRITTSGRVSEYQAGVTSRSVPSRIVAGPDRALWFTELAGDRVARVTTSGRIDEFKLRRNSQPWGIAAGPDKRIWVALGAAGRIARFKPPLLPAVPARLRWSFAWTDATDVVRLEVSEAPRGARVELRCRGGGCPNRRVLRKRRGALRLDKYFRKRLQPGARIEVRVSSPGLSASVDVFTMRRNAAPSQQDRCLPPGTKKLRRGCR